MRHSNVSLLTAILIATFLFLLGYARAVWVRARKDYKATKAAVKPLRKAMWGSIWMFTKIGTGVVVIFMILIAWNVRDVQDGDKPTPLVPAKVKPSATAKR